MEVNEELYKPKYINLIPPGKNHFTTVMKRDKRFVLSLVLITIGLLSAAAATGAITGSIALAKINVVEKNQELIANKIKEQINAINILNINQEQILQITQNVTLHVNNLISDYNCLNLTIEEEINLLNTWSNIVRNSFLRALNGF